MRRLTAIVATLAGLAVVAGAGAAAFAWSGFYNIAATAQHTQPVYTLLELVGEQSIRRSARDIAEPPLDDPALARRGAVCYRDKCMVCHGGPGEAPGEIGRSMQPLPGPLVDAPRQFRARELYWVIRHGIKMSGMPAWEFRMADADMWAVVAFMQRMPELGTAQFRAETIERTDAHCTSAEEGNAASPGTALHQAGSSQVGAPPSPAGTESQPNAARGRIAVTQFACNACHIIPGVTGSTVHVGPPLAGLATRQLIAGKLANTLENRALWIRHPQQVDPETTMPALGVGERDARDMAAYLGTFY